MSSAASASNASYTSTRRRFHLPAVPSELSAEGVRLFLDCLERRQQQTAHPMLASFLATLRGYSQHDVNEAERCAADFVQQLNEREDRKVMPAVSSALSSIRRPALRARSHSHSDSQPLPQPQPAPTVEELWLFRLPVDTLHYLLSFIPSYEFFMRLPFLSHSLQHLYTHPDLHRQYGQQRFDVSSSQWRAYSSQSWPQLEVPVWRYGYTEADEEMRQAVEQAEARQRRQQKRIARRYSRAHGRPHTKKPAANMDSLNKMMAQRRDEEKEQKEQASRQRKEAKKDWALEAAHLYQHLHFATLDLLRFAPQLTTTGVRLHYRLPRFIVASVIDSLTTRRMEPLFALERRCRAEGRVNTHRLFLPRYESFLPRSALSADVAVELPPRQIVSVGVGLDEKEVASMREALPTDVSDVAGEEASAEVEEWQITEVTQQWLDELEMEEGGEDEQEDDDEAEDTKLLEQRYRGLPSRLPHILPLVFATDQYDNPVMLDCLFFSPLLQQTLRTAAATDNASTSAADSSASSSPSLLLDLSHCPVVRFELCDDGWGPDRVAFSSADAWAVAGGMDWMCREPTALDYKRKKRNRDRHDWLGWTATDSNSRQQKEETDVRLGEGKEERREEKKAQKGLDSRRKRMEERGRLEDEYDEEEHGAEEAGDDELEHEDMEPSDEDDDEEEEEEEDEEDEDRDEDEEEDEDDYEDIPVPLELRAAHAAFMSYLLRNTDQPSQWVFEHADWEKGTVTAAKEELKDKAQ